jgi:hypothetical protein
MKKENQMRVDFIITRKLNDVIKEIPICSWYYSWNSCTAGFLAAGVLWQFVLTIFKIWLHVQCV